LSNALESWRKKLKCIIFDEVHEIGDTNGAVWEHLLALVPCQFIALSATIGYPTKFVKWMRSFAPKLADVSHVHRTTEQNFFVATFPGPKDSKLCALVPVHPLQCISRLHTTFSSDIDNLPPMNLKQARELLKLLNEKFPDAKEVIKELDPRSYFSNPTTADVPLSIDRKTFSEYEAKLRKLVIDIANMGESYSKRVGDIIELLREPLTKEYNAKCVPTNVAKQFTALLEHLHNENKLPVIVFSLRKTFCETLLATVLKELRVNLNPSNSAIDWKSLTDVSNPLLREGLKRGIGLHHAALKKSYRLEVEKLFRTGVIKVVIATGTLAMVQSKLPHY
jgi:superfamily II RNA helicase